MSICLNVCLYVKVGRFHNFGLSYACHNACRPNNQLSESLGSRGGAIQYICVRPFLCPRALKRRRRRRRSMSASNSHIPRLDQGYLICVEVSERTSTDDATSASYNLYCRDACWLRISSCVFNFVTQPRKEATNCNYRSKCVKRVVSTLFEKCSRRNDCSEVSFHFSQQTLRHHDDPCI